jgi:hypothetical protein
MLNPYRTPKDRPRRHFPGKFHVEQLTSWWIPPHGAQKEQEVATPAQVQVKNGATGAVQGSPYPVASEVSRARATPPWVRWGCIKRKRGYVRDLAREALPNDQLLSVLRMSWAHASVGPRLRRGIGEARRRCPGLPIRALGTVGSRSFGRRAIVRAFGIGVRRLRELERWCLAQRAGRVEKRTRQAS